METIEEFRNILLSQQIKVYTVHKNLIYQMLSTECVMCWRLILKEYGPELIYIKGENNTVAHSLIWLDLQLTTTTSPTTLEQMAEHFGLDDDDFPANAYPLHYKLKTSGYHIKAFCGGSKKRDLICYNNK